MRAEASPSRPRLRSRSAGARLAAAAALSLGVLGGCYRSTVRSGLPPGEVAEGLDTRWHSGWFLGAVESSGPHRADRACPTGWSEIQTRGNAVTALVAVLTNGIYTPQLVTVVCAAPAVASAPVGGYVPSPRPSTTQYPPPPTTGPFPPPPLAGVPPPAASGARRP